MPAAIFKSSCSHLECRLPINLKEFLAAQLGAVREASDENVLNLAANADDLTLSKLARAIRRYSTARAHQSWRECSTPLASFALGQNAEPAAVALCLRCVMLEFGDDALARHQTGGCVAMALGAAGQPSDIRSPRQFEAGTADTIRTLIEEFRRLRVAFGLPHFELDSYVRNGQVTFTWQPLI